MRYMLTLIGEETDPGDISPEEMQAMMEPWNEYGEALEKANAFVAGEALQPSPTSTTVRFADGGEKIVSDGPFAETKEQIGGFYVLECANLDEALEWAKKVPLQDGSSVQVTPVMDFSEFGYTGP